ncbi:cbb3-type cytochrome c oxidase subunit 3 [Yoonia sediminilitoris]|uniref:Cytochrome c oxidase cbb3-type subunit 4 n=1 Tax=Yoonia sediminilitoris TaxID=1286148 RepID=A0A2T6KI41_9RHOB|nr:cbb3-type cytochrome c oxidase subunit 3 [Yoonia sediminilitoris]PUB15400.1 cytochrome c oxidase cbb3-type subunit 4 [Yoonia sediminilitoris]RCW96010.1 cytochrome c oxidase cbb3-type subunit 4 [Yoonia sediminilitoris]
MDTYSLLREIADSWVLLGMFGFFLGAAIWAFLPSQRQAREDASMIPFRDEKPRKSCTGTCADCSAAKLKGELNV